jgi:type IV pilus assembly protein PilY1
MMKRTVFFIAAFFLAMAITSICLADDIDMYSSSNVKPNVLIIFDNSGSMAYEVPYDDGTIYTGSYVTAPITIYQYTCTKGNWHHCQQYDWVVYTGTFTDTDLDGCDDTNPTTIKKGNRLNYDNGTTFVKLAAAKTAIKDVIDTSKDYVRFGIMVLNGYRDINGSATYSQYHNDNTVLSSTYGGAIIQDRTDAQITTLKTQINNMTANGGTPLANRLIQAAKYFRGTFSNPAGGTYASPIDANNWCRKNFVIIMTDGQPEAEGNSQSAKNNGDYDDIEDNFMDTNASCRDCDHDNADPATSASGMTFVNGGSHYLDDVAYYLFNHSDSLDTSHAVNGNQNLTVYTIGFTVANQLLEHTASNAGGEYYTASNVDQLTNALNSVMQTIIEQTQIFTAPVVPVQRTTSGDKMYISLFTPQTNDKFWPGYLIKLYIGSDGNLYGNDETTRATDDADNLLLDPLLATSGSPQPYWEAHKALKGMNLDSRNIYTYVGSSTHLNTSTNAFVSTNASITSTMLGSPAKQSSGDPSHPGSAGAQYDLMRYVRGYDSYDQDGDGVYTEKRKNILGDIIHSKPLIINYGNNVQVVYVGTNDGMLHALNDSDGTEKWAFIPPDLLPKLNNMIVGSGHQYYIDGSPKAYIKDVNHNGIIESGDQVIIIFGEREGGTSYTALDVTDPNDPQYLWRIDNNTTDSTNYGFPAPTTVISELGQSWSEPEIGKVKVGTTDTIVAIIGGGYSSDNSKGRGLFLINLLTGALVKHYTIADSGTYSVLGNMTSCIPSTVLAVDTTYDGYINRVYVGDTGHQMWRFGNQAGAENGNVNNWTPRRLFQGNSGTKIFYPPDLVLEPGYAYLYFGTGDRMNPMTTSTIDRFYAVKDKNETDAAFQTRVGGVLTESNLVDVTADLLQNPSTSQSTIDSIQTQLSNGDGWYIIMENSGEKVLSPPVAIYGDVIFTTFAPNITVCSSGGDARVYAVNYLTAEAIWELDATNTGLQKTDRSQVIGTGIPTEPVVVIGEDGIARVYVAVGGKIVLINFSPGNVGFILDSWREVF